MPHGIYIQTQHAFRKASVLVLFLGLWGTPLQATTLAKLVRVPAFMKLVATIARVNQAMRSAAENPMDDFRRQNVRTAIGAMPGAIIGLANEFQAGRLHNGDLKVVQALLGGFVDVNAADNYKKFMQSPSAALIPQVGAALPSNLMQAPSNVVESKPGQHIEYDDSAKRAPASEASENSLESVGIVRDTTRASGSSLEDASRDLGALEAAQYQMQPQPQYWQFGQLTRFAEVVLIQAAHAEEGEDCKDCKRGGRGGGGGGGGIDAASSLFGLAAVMASVAPMVGATIQANADKAIAAQQASAQMYITDRTVQNSQALAQISQQTALSTADRQMQIAAQNNQGVTERLQMQLASLERARQDSIALEQQRMALESDYNNRRIALAEQQAEQNLSLAQMSVNGAISQAGMVPGMANLSSATGGALSVTPSGPSFQTSGTTIGGSNLGGAGVDQTPAGLAFRSSTPSGLAAEESVPENALSTTSRALKPTSESRLLAALRSRPIARVVAGTAKPKLVSTAEPGKSDISSFIGQPSGQASFAQYQQTATTQPEAAAAAVVRGLASSEAQGKAYKAP